MIGLYGAAAVLGVHEAIQIVAYLDARRMLRLLSESASNPPLLEGEITGKMLRKLESRGVSVDAESLQARIRELDRSGALCDGSLSGHPGAKRLRRRLVGFHRLLKRLGSDPSLSTAQSSNRTISRPADAPNPKL